MSLFEILSVGFTAFLTVDFVRYLLKGEMRKDFAAFRTLRGWRWVGAIPVVVVLLGVTAVVGLSLYVYGGVIFQFSWLNLLSTPGEKVEGQNLMVAGLQIPWFAWIFLGLLGLNLPRLAKREERAFRQHTRGVGEAVWQSFKFGLVHCLVGVPVAVGFALVIPGLFFAYVYSKGGVRLSTAWHGVYNYVILSIVVVFMVLGAWGKV